MYNNCYLFFLLKNLGTCDIINLRKTEVPTYELYKKTTNNQDENEKILNYLKIPAHSLLLFTGYIILI